MKTKDKVIALGLALCAIVALSAAVASPDAPAATYGNGYKLSKFKVEIKGWQTMVQQHTHAAVDECDVENFSSGSERFDFRTTKPIYVIASYFPGGEDPEFFSKKQVAIPTKAVVKRSYTPRISGPAIPCEENGGGVEDPPQPDCGTRTVQPFEVRLQYSERKRNALLLSSYDSAEDPFERCSGAGGFMSFPNLLVERTGSDKFIYADLSQKELFDPEFQKWISIADGTRKEQSADHWVKTHVHWEVSFTRLKERVDGR